jgi:hypothetical protein
MPAVLEVDGRLVGVDDLGGCGGGGRAGGGWRREVGFDELEELQLRLQAVLLAKGTAAAGDAEGYEEGVGLEGRVS